jgi:hypothetical protein
VNGAVAPCLEAFKERFFQNLQDGGAKLDEFFNPVAKAE